MDETKKEQKENENCAISQTTEMPIQIDTNKKYSPFCRSDCVICNSGLLTEIHTWRPEHTFTSLTEKLKNEYGLDFSRDQLYRHFKNYNQQLTGAIVKHIENFNMQVETLSEHQKRALFLGKIVYDDLLRQIDNGTLNFSLEDYKLIMDMFYKTLKDPSSAGNTSEVMIEAFQRARVRSRGGAPNEQLDIYDTGIRVTVPQRTESED